MFRWAETTCFRLKQWRNFGTIIIISSVIYFCDTGFLLFVVGMTINIHSDHILRSLRKPGETVYRIPQGKTTTSQFLTRIFRT